jgi:exopolysaccharide biosynthesis polyprenyl glycosylphosphotransferase
MLYTKYILRERSLRTLVGFVAVFAAALLAVWVWHRGDTQWSVYVYPSLLVAATFVVAMRVVSLHSIPTAARIPWSRIAMASTLSTGAILTFGFFYRAESYSRASVALFWPLSILAVGAALAALRRLQKRVLARPSTGRRVLIIGGNSVGQRIGRAIEQRPGFYDLVGYLDDLDTGPTRPDVPHLGTIDDLEDVVVTKGVGEVVIALPSAPESTVLQIISTCMRLGVSWKAVPPSYDLLFDRSDADVFDGIPVVGIRNSRLVGIDWFAKRTFDVVFSAFVLTVLAPLLLLIAVGIKLTSPGPVFFKQTRVGLDGREFTLHKFRSMRVGNAATIHEAFSSDWIHGRTGDDTGVHKMVRDPRITPIGRFLRKTSLDEAPQFWTVLRGDMSVVGPRPPLPYEVASYTEWHHRRLKVPPGITGLWQVSGRNNVSFDEMVRLDIRYMETWSLARDVLIVARTVPALLTEPGS